MATSGGPNVNRDGLVLFLDTPTNRSFRGESTENLAPSGQRTCSSNFTRRGYHVEAWSYALETNVFGRANVAKIYITPTGNNNQPYADWGFTAHKSGGSQIGDVYAVSFDYRVTKGSNTPYIGIVYGNGYKSPTSSNIGSFGTQVYEALPDGWTRYKRTVTITEAGNTWFRFTCNSDNEDTEIYVDNFQIELKSKATPFVDGTRGTTVATGGGWKDMSGNNNHGELVNGVTTDSDGTLQHSLDFDGTNDYVPITSLLNSESIGASTKLTISMWLNQTSKGSRMAFSTGQTGNDRIYYWSQNGLNTWRVGNYTSTTGHSSLPSNGVWYHTAIVIDGLTVAGYFNGELDYTGTYSAFTTVDYATLGRHGSQNAYYYSGKIATVTVNNRALTSSEILQNYKAIKSRYGL